jgi:hypothetical protein
MTDTNSLLEGWYILELFGHNMIAGYVTEEQKGGASFFRVEVPSVDDQDGFTKFFNTSAVYAFTPSNEPTVKIAVSRLAIRPVTPWVVPVPDSRHELPAPTVDEEVRKVIDSAGEYDTDLGPDW